MSARLIIASALLAVCLLAGAARAAAPTPPVADPVAFVKDVYHRLATNEDYSPPEDIYTPRLKTLWAGMTRDAHGEVGRVDFNFWTNAQDWQLKDVKITSAAVDGRSDRKVVIAKFVNDATPEEVRFYFEQTGGRWLLDDARSLGKDGWTLSLILKYGFDGH